MQRLFVRRYTQYAALADRSLLRLVGAPSDTQRFLQNLCTQSVAHSAFFAAAFLTHTVVLFLFC